MSFLYRWFLYLYPAAYRCEYGAEMMVVFLATQSETWKKGTAARLRFYGREIWGLLRGAFQEHARVMLGSAGSKLRSSKGSTMCSEFRFSKLTAPVMTVVLTVVVAAIEEGKRIGTLAPHLHPHPSPALPPQFTSLPITILTLVVAYVVSIVAGRRYQPKSL